MPSKKATQSQIARKAGVSQAAVSAVLSGSGNLNVSEETRASILEIAEKLGYVNRRASAAPKGGSDRRSVLIVESIPSGPTTEAWIEEAYETFRGKLLSAASRNLQNHGMALSVFHLGKAQQLTQWLADSEIGGVLWHADESDSALLHWVASRFPLVLLNRQWRASVPFDSVSVDQEQNILLAAEHLWAQGHRKIATFGHFTGNSFYRRRLGAYREFVEERGLRNYKEFQEISDDPTISVEEKIAAILKTLARLGKDAPTAIITGDVFALPLLRAAQQSGVRVPDQLSVVGIDNTSPCSLMEPPLTSMEEPFEELCRVAVDLLLRRKAAPDAPSQSVQIAPRLIPRKSVGAPVGPAPRAAKAPPR